MSSQKGNFQRTRPQRHQNKTAFKNDLHDKTIKIKEINSLDISGVCLRCKDIIEWKIKYKKYKPLTVPKKCTRCEQKTIHQAYNVICLPCAQQSGVCAKCGQNGDDIIAPKPSEKEQSREKRDFDKQVKKLPERKRRTLLRYIEKGGGEKDPNTLLKELQASCRKKDDEEEDDCDEDDFDSFLDDLSSDDESEGNDS